MNTLKWARSDERRASLKPVSSPEWEVAPASWVLHGKQRQVSGQNGGFRKEKEV